MYESYSQALLETRKKTAKKGPRAIQKDLEKRALIKTTTKGSTIIF
jgi:hypothetical protein